MEYNFAKEPILDGLDDEVSEHVEDLQVIIHGSLSPSQIMERKLNDEPLTEEEINQIQQNERQLEQLEKFHNEHYWFIEPITDVHRINYIIGHRGGDEFPGFKSSVNYEQLATEVLSELRAGNYKRGSGATYSLGEFEGSVSAYYKDKLPSGWLPKA